MFLYGFSAGAQFVHRFAFNHPELVVGVSAHSAGSWAGVEGWGEINDKAKGIPFALTCGELDTTKAFDGKAPYGRLDWMKVFAEDLKKRGFAVRTEVYPGVGHGGALTPTARSSANASFSPPKASSPKITNGPERLAYDENNECPSGIRIGHHVNLEASKPALPEKTTSDEPMMKSTFPAPPPASFALLAFAPALATAAPSKPNIIVIMSDDMGYSDIGCYGGEIETPNLDRLAANGLRYTHFYNTGRCCPTRASLLTGLYAHQAGIGEMTRWWPTRLPGDLSRNAVTIAEALRPAGYRTYMAGKWHVTTQLKPDGDKKNWPLQRGFDRFYGTIIGAGSFFDPWTLTRGNDAITPDNDEEYQPEQYYYTDAISDYASRYVREHAENHADQPFFMYVSYTAAHWPCTPSNGTSPNTRAAMTPDTRRSARHATRR
jgi:hypothetical protein